MWGNEVNSNRLPCFNSPPASCQRQSSHAVDDENDTSRGEEDMMFDYADDDTKAISISGSTVSKAASPSSRSRKDSSLGFLTKRFIDFMNTEGARNNQGVVDLKEAATELKIRKRRLYDITNVLEGIGMITKENKNRVKWTNIYQQEYVGPSFSLPPSANATAAATAPLYDTNMVPIDPLLKQSHTSIDTSFSSSSASLSTAPTTSLSSSSTASRRFNSNAPSLPDDTGNLSWLRPNKQKEHERLQMKESINLMSQENTFLDHWIASLKTDMEQSFGPKAASSSSSAAVSLEPDTNMAMEVPEATAAAAAGGSNATSNSTVKRQELQCPLYVTADDIAKTLDWSSNNVYMTLNAPADTLCEVPHPDDGLGSSNDGGHGGDNGCGSGGKADRRHQLFLRSKGQISAHLLTRQLGGEGGEEISFKLIALNPEKLDPCCYEKRHPVQSTSSNSCSSDGNSGRSAAVVSIAGAGGPMMEVPAAATDGAASEVGAGMALSQSSDYGNEYWASSQSSTSASSCWVQFWDANSQKHYYYNTNTGRTQWEAPDEGLGEGVSSSQADEERKYAW